MAKGLFDDVPMLNKERDQAWEKFIKRKDVKAMMKGKEDFKFPLDGSYELWCIAWGKAWDAGFQSGRDKGEWEELNVNDAMGLIAEHITDPSPELRDEIYGLIKEADMLLQEKNA